MRKRERERIMVFNATFNYISVIEFSIGFWNCSDSVVFFFFISFHYIILTSRNGIKSLLQINTIKEQRLHLRSFIHVHITLHYITRAIFSYIITRTSYKMLIFLQQFKRSYVIVIALIDCCRSYFH